MTEHRTTDLEPGHLGEANYHTEENEWSFSQFYTRDDPLQQVLPFQQCVTPAARDDEEKYPKDKQIQLKWLIKARPEVIPANGIVSTFVRASSALAPVRTPDIGALFAVGRALNEDLKNSRSFPIFAMPSGEAGHILKLIRPRIEKHIWDQNSVGLSLMNPAHSEKGHWVGSGGTIRQIVFAEDLSGPATWFAIRQDMVTSIFRPMYLKSPIAHSAHFPPSSLNPNHVANLTIEQTGSKPHADVTFNPWYLRQFAVVDELGRWSTWDIEGQKQSTFAITSGKSGKLDEVASSSRLPVSTDSWFRLLWAGSVSTIVVCSRWKLEVLDISGETPTCLYSPELVPKGTPCWIVDVKRSAENPCHVFILTTSRVFWIEVVPTREDGKPIADQNASKIILSYRHFRNSTDDCMSLAVSKNKDVSIVLIWSSNSPLVNFYFMWTNDYRPAKPVAIQGSVSLFDSSDGSPPLSRSLQAVCVTPSPFFHNSLDQVQDTGVECIEKGVAFYQIWAHTVDLGLYRTLFAVKSIEHLSETPFKVRIKGPTLSRQVKRHFGPRVISNESFIVPDDQDESNDELNQMGSLSGPSQRGTKSWNDLRLRINWRPIFQRIYSGVDRYEIRQSRNPDISSPLRTMDDIIERIRDRLHRGTKEGGLALLTLLDISGIVTLSEDLDQSAKLLQAFLDTITQDQEFGASDLTLSELPSYPAATLFTPLTPNEPNTLMSIYDRLAHIWIASLPLKLSSTARLAKHKAIRNIAVELSLSSIAISLRPRLSQGLSFGEEEVHLPRSAEKEIDAVSRASSPPIQSTSQGFSIPLEEAHLSLHTPTRTPSLHSHESFASRLDRPEDSAIPRLQAYTSIKSQDDVGSVTSRILAFWPSSPGADPANYKWEALSKDYTTEDSGEEGSQRSASDKARRRRRTQRFLRSESIASQSTIPTFGSQPAMGQHAFSSQTVDGMPMTQPDRGQHGSSRQAKIIKKKKRRAAGF